MTDYVTAALLVYEPIAEDLLAHVVDNSVGTAVKPVSLEQLLQDPASGLVGVEHVVVAASLVGLKQVLRLAIDYKFSVGVLPVNQQDKMARYLNLPPRQDEAITFALRSKPASMDIILCNEQIMLFRGSIGWIPMLDSHQGVSKLRLWWRSMRKFTRLKLLAFNITTSSGKTIRTAASGCMLVQRHSGDLVSELIENDSSIRDGATGLVLASPISIVEYIKFLFQLLLPPGRRKSLPSAIGYIKSSELRIEPDLPLDVFIDGERATTTPVTCTTLPAAVRVNVGPALSKTSTQSDASKETIKVANLPNERELKKSLSKRIPFFSYASEDRFKELFRSLRDDSRVSATYLALMILSTVLATVGLYLNNAAVIIGAMLLAPLMAPLVSSAMGLLRGDSELFWNSNRTIVVGVLIALATAALTTLAFPHKPVTDEMLGRLNPTLLDLVVAVVSGVAAAYARSYREIAQNLAGVAIAVALVPPLAVAGIGVGHGDIYFFLQAFLLFLTNMVGIILAAMFTFRFLGFSPVVKGRRGLRVMLLLLAAITVPLYLSYNQIVDRVLFEKKLETDRYYINGKYLQVFKVDVSYYKNRLLLVMDILVREPLTRQDLSDFKSKLQGQFDEKLIVQTKVTYFL